MGHKRGEVVKVEVPRGPKRKLEDHQDRSGLTASEPLVQVQVHQLDVEDPAELLAAAALRAERAEAGALVDRTMLAGFGSAIRASRTPTPIGRVPARSAPPAAPADAVAARVAST